MQIEDHIEAVLKINTNIETISGTGSLLRDGNVDENVNHGFNGNPSDHDDAVMVSSFQGLEIFTEISNTERAITSADRTVGRILLTEGLGISASERSTRI